jgi:hypothetical protein
MDIAPAAIIDARLLALWNATLNLHREPLFLGVMQPVVTSDAAAFYYTIWGFLATT